MDESASPIAERPKESMSSLRLSHLRLDGYRCFDSFDIDFHPKLTVLTAANGAGKTSILDAIAVAFGPFLGAFDEGQGKHFESSDIRRVRARATRSNEMEHAPDGASVIALGIIPADEAAALRPRPQQWRRGLAGPVKSRTTLKDAKVLIDYGKRLQRDVREARDDVLLPVLAYYGTGRLWHHKKLTGSKLTRTSRTIGYRDCMDPASSYKSFVEWFRYWTTNALKVRLDALERGKLIPRTEFDDFIDSVSGAVNTCLRPSGWRKIAYSLNREELVAHHPIHGELPVELLSDGIRNMVGMVADIAFRATKLNPHLGADAARKTPGVVMIDEVDMHLHPEWQQTVMTQLRKAFPAVQFIVTTHSPQVLSTIAKECIRTLEGDAPSTMTAEEPVADTYGMPSNFVLQAVMDVDPQPPVKELGQLNRLTELVDQGRYRSAEAKRIWRQLASTLGPSHEQLQRLQRSVDRQKALQRLSRSEGTRARGDGQ
jgi:predicted ATP-binding protein involved in virulence